MGLDGNPESQYRQTRALRQITAPVRARKLDVDRVGGLEPDDTGEGTGDLWSAAKVISYVNTQFENQEQLLNGILLFVRLQNEYLKHVTECDFSDDVEDDSPFEENLLYWQELIEDEITAEDLPD